CEADHLVTGARVAIKLLAPHARELPQAEPRLLREARVLGALRHPNIVAVYDAGKCPTFGAFVVLELIEGRPLDGILLTRHRLPIDQTVAMALQVCDALDAAHRQGIVHRDVKPGNVLITSSGSSERVELIDFGIAKLVHGETSEDFAPPSKITKMGEVVGTIDYMAPEQLMDTAPIDGRADVYAVGSMLYECLTGEMPYTGTMSAMISNFASGVRPQPMAALRPDVPPQLEGAVRRALEIKPDNRWSTCAQLARACLQALGSRAPALSLLETVAAPATPPPAAPAPTPAAAAAATLEAARAPTGSHRRQYARAPYVTPVRVLLDGGATYDGRSEDLSEGGLLIVTDYGGADNQRVKLKFPLPLSGRVVTLDARTKWAKTRRGQRATGVELIDVPDDVRSEIQRYVALMAKANAGVA
ncbi:MAG TPA: serine/threonine-protein kinase, partial [Polyangiales bacterium]|nr:serine/threonine-protein kinase [Polyangiales bacterium]